MYSTKDQGVSETVMWSDPIPDNPSSGYPKMCLYLLHSLLIKHVKILLFYQTFRQKVWYLSVFCGLRLFKLSGRELKWQHPCHVCQHFSTHACSTWQRGGLKCHTLHALNLRILPENWVLSCRPPPSIIIHAEYSCTLLTGQQCGIPRRSALHLWKVWGLYTYILLNCSSGTASIWACCLLQSHKDALLMAYIRLPKSFLQQRSKYIN